ncbi:hypothetical protein BGX28_004951 [Mortierella sp. GBA30]|nr:hypothetical protein BGX28_004951 [Mortierella sp. GBA30]
MSLPPPLKLATKPKRSVSFLNHGVDTKSKLGRSSFQPGRRQGYVRKGPVQSDEESEEDEDEAEDEDEEEDEVEEDEEDEEEQHNQFWTSKGAVAESEPTTTNVNLTGISQTFNHSVISKTAVRPGQNYVRKAPINSDTESDEETLREERTSSPQQQKQQEKVAKVNEAQGDTDSDTDQDNDEDVEGLVRPFAAHARVSGPGQNYVRKAPVTSDAESDEDEESSKGAKAGHTETKVKGANAGMAEHAPTTTVPAATTPQGQPWNTASNPSVTSAENGLIGLSAPMNTIMANSTLGHAPVMAGDAALTPALATANTAGVAPNKTNTPGLGMTLANSSGTSLSNSSTTSAQANLATSMAIYQQQQQEMMMIMQQQQIQIATMQQQQQAYQFLVLQQQQHHQQQLQAVQLQHSRGTSSDGSMDENTGVAHVEDHDNDDDMPLGEKQQQLPTLPEFPLLPQLPQFTSLMDAAAVSSRPGTPPLQQPQPVMAGAPSAAHILMQQSPQQDKRTSQASISSLHSTTPSFTLPHLHAQPIVSSPLNPATSSPLPPHHSLLQQQAPIQHPVEEDQYHQQQQQLGSSALLTSSFPAGYRHSMGSVALGQLSGHRGSVTSLHSTGSNGSSGQGSGSKANGSNAAQRYSLMPQPQAQYQHLPQQQQQQHPHPFQPYQQQTLIQSMVPSPAVSPVPFMGHPTLLQQQQLHHQHHTLIHVEAKPPPPQTGLVGAITAMERDKKLAKAQGTNQLQYQHQQQQQQMLMNTEKERWLQEQRRLAWEASQMPQQQQQQQHYMMMQQQQSLLYPNMVLGQQHQMQQMQIQPQQWTMEDEEDDNRPLGSH